MPDQPRDITEELVALVHNALCNECGVTGTGLTIRAADSDKIRGALRAKYPHGIAMRPATVQAPDETVTRSADGTTITIHKPGIYELRGDPGAPTPGGAR